MTINDRITQIKNSQQDECWYITKHNLNFKNLCYCALIVSEYSQTDKSENYETFFNNLALKYGISQNHRATNNCYYVGLLEHHGQYSEAIPTEVFLELNALVNSNFNELDLNHPIVIDQLEKVFTSNPIDQEFNGLRSDFKIHPAYFLSRVLISLGNITGNYSISLDEFYLFIGTSKKYYEHYLTTQLILENRKNNFQLTNKFNNNRFHLLLENLPYIQKEGNKLIFNKIYENELKTKLLKYESNLNDNLFSINYLKKVRKSEVKSSIDNSIQKIFYGAPGTGKSYKVNELVKDKDDQIQRVTFHPEYDYASFIGGYKPTMAEEDGKEVIKYKFVPQAFTNMYVKAWNDPNKDYYLVIEEINRGNCAEIFGDIFQLLDRDSDYDITPSKELKDYLLDKEEGLKDENFGLKNGKLKLPNNLSIYATMNTSDQSLFPMDSAFKRRWDWEYIPICYEKLTDEGKPNPSFDNVVDLGNGTSFKWNDFISKVNLEHIQQNPILGMDKCMGNYFVKPKKGETTIAVETFINKAIFYLWNDVFKDEKNEVFEDNSSYEDFFPIKSKGIQKLKELLERIEVTIITTTENSEPEKDEDTN